MDIIYKVHGLFVSKAHAQLGQDIQTRIGELESGSITNENQLVDAIVNIAAPVAVLCLIVLVIYAGYMLISSQGNPDKLREGKEVLTNAIIGFFVILLSVVILLLISNTLELNIYN